jgi:hypothetical protein
MIARNYRKIERRGTTLKYSAYFSLGNVVIMSISGKFVARATICTKLYNWGRVFAKRRARDVI